jgi:hypothetical protein
MANSVKNLRGIQRCCSLTEFALNYTSGHASTRLKYIVFISGYEVTLEVTCAYTIKADYCIHCIPPTVKDNYPIAGQDTLLGIGEIEASKIS